MTKKQLGAIVFSILLGGVLILGGALYLFQTHPEYLGLPPTVGVADSAAAAAIDSTAILAELERQRKEQQVINERDSLATVIRNLVDSLDKVDSRLNSSQDSVVEFQARFKKFQDKEAQMQDSVIHANLAVFAKIYDGANPADVAQILQNLDDRDAAIVLKLMKKKNAAKVLEQMNPERAASIMTLSYLAM